MLTSPLSANKVAGNIITMYYIHRRNIARNTVYIHWSHCCFFLYFFLSHIGSNAIWISCRNNQSRQARASNGATPSHSLTNARTPFTWPCFFLQVVYYANSPSVYAQPHFVCKIIWCNEKVNILQAVRDKKFSLFNGISHHFSTKTLFCVMVGV